MERYTKKATENEKTGAQQRITSIEKLCRAQLDAQLVLQSNLAVDLPEIEIPELESIHVAVNMPAYADQERLDSTLRERLAEIFIENADRIQRQPGEPLAQGDKVYMDIISYIDGRIAPFGSHENLAVFLEPGTLVPGFAESLIGAPVGSRVIVLTAFPEDYPESSVRGKNVSISVHIRAAEELRFPDQQAFPVSGTDPQQNELVDQILKEILEEEGLKYKIIGVNLALDTLAEKPMEAISDRLLEACLKGEWVRLQGKFLQTQGVPQEDRETALQQWLQNPDLKDEMRKRLAVTLSVRAVAIKHGLTEPSEEEFQEYLRSTCEQMQLGFEELVDSLSSEQQIRNQLREQFVYLRTVDFIADNVHMEFLTC